MLSTSVGIAVALGLGGSRFLVSDLLIGAAYSATQSAAAVSVIFTLKTDGTWAITFGAGDTGGGTPLTGTWLLAGGVAADYEVKYTFPNQVNSPTIVNDAAAFTAMSANRVGSVSKTNADASSDFQIEIRKIAKPGEYTTDSSNFAAEGAP